MAVNGASDTIELLLKAKVDFTNAVSAAKDYSDMVEKHQKAHDKQWKESATAEKRRYSELSRIHKGNEANVKNILTARNSLKKVSEQNLDTYRKQLSVLQQISGVKSTERNDIKDSAKQIIYAEKQAALGAEMQVIYDKINLILGSSGRIITANQTKEKTGIALANERYALQQQELAYKKLVQQVDAARLHDEIELTKEANARAKVAAKVNGEQTRFQQFKQKELDILTAIEAKNRENHRNTVISLADLKRKRAERKIAEGSFHKEQKGTLQNIIDQNQGIGKVNTSLKTMAEYYRVVERRAAATADRLAGTGGTFTKATSYKAPQQLIEERLINDGSGTKNLRDQYAIEEQRSDLHKRTQQQLKEELQLKKQQYKEDNSMLGLKRRLLAMGAEEIPQAKSVDQSRGASARTGKILNAIEVKRLNYSKRIVKVLANVTANTNAGNLEKNREILIGLRAQAIHQKNSKLIRTINTAIKRNTSLLEGNTTATSKNSAAKSKNSHIGGTGTGNSDLSAGPRPGFWDTMTGSMGGKNVGSTFGHKAATTLQYAAAGTGIYAIASAARKGLQSVVDFDEATRTMAAVLGESHQDMQKLGQELNDLGKTFGGVQKEIYGITLALGRAGVATEELTSATEVTMKMARLTGDTFEDSSKAIISYNTVFGKDAMGNVVYTVEELGDKMAKLANASRLSTQDIGTFSNYALSAARTAGLTVDAVGGMAASFNNAGLSASTTGTQIRSFTRILTDQSEGVKKLFTNMGLVQKTVAADIRKGGQESNDALRAFGKELQSLSDNEFAEFTDGLNIRARSSLATMRQNFDEFSRLMRESATDSNGELKKTSVIIKGFSVTWERVINQMRDASTDILNPALQTTLDFFAEFGNGMDMLSLKIKHLEEIKKSKGLENPSGFLGITPIGMQVKLLGDIAALWSDNDKVASDSEYNREKNILIYRTHISRLVQDLRGVEGVEAGIIKQQIDQYNALLAKESAQHKFLGSIKREQQLRGLIDATAAAYIKAEQSGNKILADHHKTELISLNKKYNAIVKIQKVESKKAPAEQKTPEAVPVDLKSFASTIAVGSRGMQDMSRFQTILNRLTKEQVRVQQEGINKVVEKSAVDKKINSDQKKAILDITNNTKTMFKTTEGIAKLQVLSETAVGNYSFILSDVIEKLQVQQGLQQTAERSQNNINQAAERRARKQEEMYAEARGYFDDAADAIDAEVAGSNASTKAGDRKLTQLDKLNDALQRQIEKLEMIRTLEVDPNDPKAAENKAARIIKEQKKINKISGDIENRKYNDRVRFEEEYLKKRQSLHGTAIARQYGLEKAEAFKFWDWHVLNENLSETGAATAKANIYYENYIKERTRMHKEMLDKGVTAEEIAERDAVDRALLAQRAKQSEQAAYGDPLGLNKADTDHEQRREAAELGQASRDADLQAEFEADVELMKQRGASEYEFQVRHGDLMHELKLSQAEADREIAVSTAVQTSDQVAGIAGSMATTMDNLRKSGVVKSKSAFKAMQAMQIVAATAETYSAATKAYSAVASTPYVGPALGAAAAAGAIAAGMANVAAIKAQTFHTGGTVGPTGQKLRSDEIPAVLQTGEMVLSRQDLAGAKQAPAQANETVIINSIDPAVIESYMTSRSGREVINNVVNA